MDVKSTQNISTSSLVGDKPEPEGESVLYYIAVKGSLHAFDCAVFGLKEEEVKALESKYSRSIIVNGVAFKTNVLNAVNSLVQLGYKVLSSTELGLYYYSIMDHKDCNHSSCAGTNANSSVCQTLSEMDWERGLWYAAFNGEKDRVQLLIDKAKNAKDVVTAPDNAGYTALHYAARNGYVDICKILLQYGANIDALTKSARATPLHKAAASGKISTVELMISRGATVDAQDVDGETALHKAMLNKNIELANALIQACPRLQNIADRKGRLPSDEKRNE